MNSPSQNRTIANDYSKRLEAIIEAHKQLVANAEPSLQGLTIEQLREALIPIIDTIAQSSVTKACMLTANMFEEMTGIKANQYDDINTDRIQASIRYCVGLLPTKGLHAVIVEMQNRVEKETKQQCWNLMDLSSNG
ncbi:MAG: hypothetical protein HUJ74_00355 [Lachnospiraceae bacterium]|nr:hypothetical protein [Lachnospiraceae bacterium]